MAAAATIKKDHQQNDGKMEVVTNKTDPALLIVGNSGVGKSFLCNILIRKNRFLHAISATSVTAAIDGEMTMIGNQPRFVLNLPGLMEADSKKWTRNQKAIESAFQTQQKQIIVFVLGNANGRLMASDVSMFTQLTRAYGLTSNSTLVVLNQKPKQANWEVEMITALRELSGWQGPLYYVGIDTLLPAASDGSFCFASSAADVQRERLCSVLEQAVPVAHTKLGELMIDSAVQLKQLQIQLDQLARQKQASTMSSVAPKAAWTAVHK
jgi:GTP-binding protein EngB required for normal cell division